MLLGCATGAGHGLMPARSAFSHTSISSSKRLAAVPPKYLFPSTPTPSPQPPQFQSHSLVFLQQCHPLNTSATHLSSSTGFPALLGCLRHALAQEGHPVRAAPTHSPCPFTRAAPAVQAQATPGVHGGHPTRHRVHQPGVMPSWCGAVGDEARAISRLRVQGQTGCFLNAPLGLGTGDAHAGHLRGRLRVRQALGRVHPVSLSRCEPSGHA